MNNRDEILPDPDGVSVVIPTCDRPEMLRRALDSVLQQTRRPDEVIVVDQGAGIGAQQVVAACPRQVCYLRQEKRGPAAARNLGIHAARCGWIAFLDDDDVWVPEKTRVQLETLAAAPGAVLAYS